MSSKIRQKESTAAKAPLVARVMIVESAEVAL